MDSTLLLKALILGIVEGLTEFLPISSTGHLILAADLLGFNDNKGKIFEIVIQTGAMLAIVWEYRQRFARVLTGLFSDIAARRFVLNVLVAFMPAAIMGLLFGSAIKAMLFKPVPVAIAFIVGAFVILWAEKRQHRIRVVEVDDMRWRDALLVGCAQCFALIPGTSRSGATIMMAIAMGLARAEAAEFSFILGMITLTAAGGYKFLGAWRHGEVVGASLTDVTLAFLAAAISAFLVVRWLLQFVRGHSFNGFAIYRILLGAALLLSGK